MIPTRPPGRTTFGSRASSRSSAPSSSFTAIRRAWNVRVAGSIPPLRGTQLRTASASSPVVYPLRRAPFDDPPGDPAAEPLFAVFEDHVRQTRFAQRVHEVGRRGTGSAVQSHIERAVVFEAQPAVGVVQLIRTEAEVGEDAIDPRDPQVLKDFGQLVEVRRDQRHRQAGQSRFGQRQHGPILIEANQPARGAEFHRAQRAVAAAAGGAVDPRFARSRVEEAQRLRGQDGDVANFQRRGHTADRKWGQGEPGGVRQRYSGSSC